MFVVMLRFKSVTRYHNDRDVTQFAVTSQMNVYTKAHSLNE